MPPLFPPRPSRRRSQSSRRLARTPRSSASACASSIILNEAYATLKTKEQESGDTTANIVSLATARDKAALYGVTINITDIAIPELGIRMCYTTRRDLMNAQNAVQYAIDKEDNELKQDTVSLNSYVSKRDNSFSTASKLVRKALDASGSTIGNIG